VNISATDAATFAGIVKLDDAVRTNHALAAMGSDWQTRARGEDNLKVAKARFFAAIDTLTPEQAKAFGEYRSAAKLAESLTMATPSIF
jgi:hypothetical protein